MSDKPLVDDLADVLSSVVPWYQAEHPDIVRVMARYRESKEGPCYACGATGTQVPVWTTYRCSNCRAVAPERAI